MPVRIYDISKRLGLENKEVLAKAKQLVLPIYGKKKVARFLQMMESAKISQ